MYSLLTLHFKTLHSKSISYVKKLIRGCISGNRELPLRSIERIYFINLFVEQDSQTSDDKPAKRNEVKDDQRTQD